MKNASYLLVLLICFAGCQKREVAEGVKFTKILFGSAMKFRQGIYITFEGKIYASSQEIPLTYGNKQFGFYKSSGEKFMDTVININGPMSFFIYQPDSITAPVLVTELPPPPPPPVDPLDPLKDEPAAPDGYMKIKIANKVVVVLPFVKMDVLINTSQYDEQLHKLILAPLDTIRGVTKEYGNQFSLVKRALNGKNPVTDYYFTFINPVNGEMIKYSDGRVYEEAYGYLDASGKSNFMFFLQETDMTAVPDFHSICIQKGDKYYYVEIMSQFEN